LSLSLKRKIALWGLGIAAFLGLLALVFLYYAPRVIRTDTVREFVTVSASRYLGRSVHIDRMDFHVLPFPSLVLDGVSLSSRGGVDARTDEIRLYPSLRNLLRGSLVPGGVELIRPQVRVVPVETPRVTPPVERTLNASFFEELSAQVLTAAGLLSLFPPELQVSTFEGRVEFQLAGRPRIRLENVNLSAEVRGSLLHILLDADSSLWRRMSLMASARIAEAHFEGALSLQDFHADILQEFLPRSGVTLPGPLPADVEMDMSIRGLAQDYRFTLAAPRFPVRYEGREFSVEKVGLKGALAVREDGLDLAIDDLRIGQPELQASGHYQKGYADDAGTRADIQLTQADVAAVRHVLVPVFPALEGSHGLFRILRGGRVSGVEFVAHGPDARGLLAPANWVLAGRGEGLEIEVPHFPFPISEATGNVRIEQGILSGRNLSGTIEGGRLTGAGLILDLFRADGVFGLEGDGEISMKTLLALLKEYIRNDRVRSELFRLRDVYGRAEGRVALGGTRRHIDVKVRDAALSLAVSHEKLPFRLRVDRGTADYADRSVGFRHLFGSMGSSSFGGVSGRVSWAGEPVLRVDNGGGKADLPEFLALVRRTQTGAELTLGIQSVERGIAEISEVNLEGPLFVPRAWTYHLTGRFREVTGRTEALPGELTIDRGDFEVSTDAFAARYLRMRAMQAEVWGDVGVSGYRAGPAEWNLDLSGLAGTEATRYVSGRLRLPEKIQVMTPVSFSNLWIRHRSGEGGNLQGTLGFESGVTVRTAIRYTPGDIEVDDLEIRDGSSSARMRLVATKRTADVEFRGTLRQETLDGMIRAPEGWWQDSLLEGEALFHLDFAQPFDSLFTGRLAGRGFTLPVTPVGPVHIDRVSLLGRGSVLHVQDAELRVFDQTFLTGGEVRASEDALVLSLDVSAEGIPWSRIRAALRDREATTGTDKKEARERAFPVKGVVRLQAGYLELGGYTWRPFLGDLVLEPDGSRRLDIRDAALCDISSTGTVEQVGDRFRLDLNLQARQQEFAPTVLCLSEKRSAMTGVFDLSGSVKSAGAPSELIRSATGVFTMKATDGRIHRAVLLARVLEFLTVTEVIKGAGFEGLDKGFAYNSLDVQGDMANGILNIRQAALDGGAMDLVMAGTVNLETNEIQGEILVAPFTTVDAVVKRIPIVSYILDGSIVTVPLEVRGTVTEPTISPMSALGTGKRLLGLLGRVLGAPVKVIEPILPGGSNP